MIKGHDRTGLQMVQTQQILLLFTGSNNIFDVTIVSVMLLLYNSLINEKLILRKTKYCQLNVLSAI